ncbi:MAG: peptidylprolyl isomerase [Flavobacteriales bacterium]|jgi:peptidyl-prolyl cis-trans isomerase B (cyclophilin B)|nr:peptidylprolyl isomerase [Flavobacteriales bacterium]
MSKVREAAIRWSIPPLRAGAVACLMMLAAASATLRAQAGSLVEIRTELGTMVVRLYDETPVHRDNFLRLVREGAYDSLLFHRVVPGFMVQGGDPDSRTARPGQRLGDGGPGHTLPAEVVPGLIHRKGAVAAARLGDDVDPERRSSGSQFYIVQGRPHTADDLDRVVERQVRHGTHVRYTAEDRMDYERQGGAPHLDGAYTVFGQVVAGLGTIDAIAAVPCDQADRPLKDVRMFMHIRE